MAAKYWIKLYIEILDDPKMGRMSEVLFARCIKLFLLAGDTEQDGGLPPLSDMAWRLRLDEEQLESDLYELQKLGIVEYQDGQWFVCHFAERQEAMKPAEKMRRQRAEKQKEQYYPRDQRVTKPVTDSYRSVTKSNAESDEEEESEREEEEKKKRLRLPFTPLEASQHPDIQLFQKVSGVFPGQGDYRMIIDAATLLRQAHPDESDLETYLLAFWLRWQGMKRKDGQPVSMTNPTWFTEWAVQNYTPSPAAEKVPVAVSSSKAALAKVRASLKEKA